MAFLTTVHVHLFKRYSWIILGLILALPLQAQTGAPQPTPSAVAPIDLTGAPTGTTTDTNSTPVAPVVDQTNSVPIVTIQTPTPTASTPATPPATGISKPVDVSGSLIIAALLTLGSLTGFLLYQSGLTRAKNCGHSATLLLLAVVFGWIGYWMGGFAVQMGGIGDTHAALTATISPASRNLLNHELGFVAGTHYWGLMGSSGFFLMTDPESANGIAALFLGQAALLTIAIAAAIGAGLERSRLTAMAIGAFLAGALIYPLLANWIWGGGWLAELGREFTDDGLGHGFVDWAGGGVVHETAGTLALVIAVVLGPRHGRFARAKLSIPGHHLPFVVLGALVLLISWTAANASAGDSSSSGLSATNTLIAAAGGLLASFLLAAGKKKRPEPALLCRGLLGGAVASCGGCALVDPWAAFVIGGLGGLLVQGAVYFLERRRIDDPTGAAAVHGVAGAWGLLATGLFANGASGRGLNGVDGPVNGLFFGGAWHQLASQVIGCATIFAIVYLLGYVCFTLVQKIVGLRVSLPDETGGLDGPLLGAQGYQGDADPDDLRKD